MEYIGHDDNFVYITGTTKEANSLGAVFVKSKNAFRLPITNKTLQDLYTEIKDKEILPLLQDAKNQEKQAIQTKAKEDTEGNKRLRPYQRVDVEFIKSKDSVAVFNEQRTGKTPTILTAVQEYLGQGIVVCPASLKLNWQKEFEQWVDDTSLTYVISGTKSKRFKMYEDFANKKAKMLFMSYETLRADLDTLMFLLNDIDVLIVDEAHRLRNFQTRQSIAVYRLGKIAKHIYPMTGTPAVNHPSDVFGILRLIQPEKYTSYWQFVDRYFGYVEGRFGRELLDVRKDRADELTEVLTTSSVQRKRKDVMSWIPKITDRKVYIDLDASQVRHLKKITEEFMYGENIIPNIIAQLTRIRQVSLDPALLDLKGKSAKTEFLLDFLEDNDGKVIVFSVFTSYLKILKDLILNSVLLTGEMTSEQKSAAVDSVQNGNTRVLLANIQVGGTGWTLDNIDTIIFTDRSFNPIDNEQAADRFVPTDPNKTYGAKQIITLISNHRIERSIDQLINEKISIIQFINNYGMNALVNYDGKENNNNAGVSN